MNIVNDDDGNESRVFKIEITSTTPAVNFGLGGNEATFKKTVVIVNDDCPTKYSFWFGAISVEDAGFATTQGVGSATPAGTCDILRVNNDLPAIGSATNTIYDIILVPDFEGASTGTATVETTISRTAAQTHPTLGVLDAVYTATGFYDEDTKQIILDYTVGARNANGNIVGSFYSGTNIITKP